MNHSLYILWSGVKFTLHLVHFVINSELQLQEATKLFSYFWLQLVRMKSSKKLCARFLITFLLFKILPYITFLFPLKSVLKIENPSEHKSADFFGIAGTVLLSGYFLKCTPLLKELRQRLFKFELEHCTLTEYLLRRLMLFHWYCNFNPPARLNDVWCLWNAWYFS